MMPKRTHKTVQQFTTGGPAATLFYIVVNDELTVETTPVVGWITKREHFEGDTPEDAIYPGVLNTEFHTIETPEEVYGLSMNTAMVGVYFGDERPDQTAIEAAKHELHERLTEQWREAEKTFREPYCTQHRQQLAKWGTQVAS